MDKQSYDKRPDSTFLEIGQSENEILLGKRWRFLPRPNAGTDASQYEQRIDSQGSVTLLVAVTPNVIVGAQPENARILLNACGNDALQNVTQQPADNPCGGYL